MAFCGVIYFYICFVTHCPPPLPRPPLYSLDRLQAVYLDFMKQTRRTAAKAQGFARMLGAAAAPAPGAQGLQALPPPPELDTTCFSGWTPGEKYVRDMLVDTGLRKRTLLQLFFSTIGGKYPRVSKTAEHFCFLGARSERGTHLFVVVALI